MIIFFFAFFRMLDLFMKHHIVISRKTTVTNIAKYKRQLFCSTADPRLIELKDMGWLNAQDCLHTSPSAGDVLWCHAVPLTSHDTS